MRLLATLTASGLGVVLACPYAKAQVPTPAPSHAVVAPAPPPPPAVTTEEQWYGWQILAVDAAGIATGSVARATLDFDAEERPPGLGLVAGSWFGVGAVAAPAVHYAHGNGGLGVASLGMRLLVPPLSGFFGFLGTCLGRGDIEHDCVVDGYSMGSIIGLAGTAALDASLLAWERPAPTAPERHWYGWQLMLVDGAALLAGVAMSAQRPENEEGERLHPAVPPWALGYLVGLVGGPVVHFTHGRVGTGFISLGARALAGPMLVLPAMAGYCAATAGVKNCSNTGALWGLLGGLVAVDLFDALVLAHEEVASPPRAAWQPFIGVGPNSLFVAGYWP